MGFRAMAAALMVAVAALGCGPARAEETPRLELAREIMREMQVERALGEFFTQMAPMISASASRQGNLNASDEARLTQLVIEEFRNATPGMVEEMAGVYAQRMSEQDLRETVSFLRTPAGAAFLRTQFDAQAELERIGMAAGMRVGVQAVARFEAERRAAAGGGRT